MYDADPLCTLIALGKRIDRQDRSTFTSVTFACPADYLCSEFIIVFIVSGGPAHFLLLPPVKCLVDWKHVYVWVLATL